MPGLGSPRFDYRSTGDRELTLNSLKGQRNKSPLLAEKPEQDDRYSSLSDRNYASNKYRDRASLLDKGTFDDRPIIDRNSPGSDHATGLRLSSDRKPSNYGLGYGQHEQPAPKLRPGGGARSLRPQTSEERGDSTGRRSSLLGDRRPGSGGLLAALADDLEEEERERHGAISPSKAKKKKKKNPVSANLSGTRYEVVRQMAEHLGFIISKDEDPNAFLLWNDSFVSTDRISELKPYQKINHFPGMGEICRKDCLARNMAKMAKAYPEDFNFVPKTWILPTEYNVFQNYAKELKKKKKNKVFIVKPANGAMGNGISLYKNAEKIPQNDNYIVQEYLDKPFLVDGYKCDMRIYVLVTSCDPLRIFLYHDGLLRMSTEKYVHPSDTNIEHLYMHLTNYSVNKHNDNYDKSGTIDTGSKRTLKFFNDYLRRNDYDVVYLWRNITDMIIKTLIVGHPHMLHGYRMCRPGQPPASDSVCFEILGFDVMIDKKLRPWLLEINRSPSFGTDERLDYDIKSGVIEDTLKLLNIKASDKRKNMAAQKAQAQKRLLRPTKRVEGESSEMEKKRLINEKRKEELKDMLVRIRKDAAREEHENRYSGRFKRIFPPDDKFHKEQFAGLLSDVFGVFQQGGRSTSLQQEIQKTYSTTLREEDVLDMIAQCEADERDGKTMTPTKGPRGPKPLQSMPSLAKEPDPLDDEDEDEDDDEEDEDGETRPQTRGRSWGRPTSGKPAGSRPTTKGQKSRMASSKGLKGIEGTESGGMTVKEWEEEMTKHTLAALNDMRIKFPGKSDEEADYLLDKLHENWKFHKPRIASYWLVKLDSIKRRKVIDIVRSNVRAVLQRTWKTTDIDSLHLYRIVNRVFNRLLWSHGQGLWNCFQDLGGNSWETIFSKSTESIGPMEMACSRRIVQLCRDCLLIVYQFAADAKNAASQSVPQETHPDSARRTPSAVPTDKHAQHWNPNMTVSQKLSRLYNSRSQSLNSVHRPS